MTILKRRILSISLILLFIILAPTIVFYAMGNIIGEGWNILPTGGISIKAVGSGSEIFINEKFKEKTSFLTRDYFLKNLRPGKYTVLVKKDNYNDWSNEVVVYANRVTEVRAFMLPTVIKFIAITEYLEKDNLASSTKPIAKELNPDFVFVTDLFRPEPAEKISKASLATSSKELGPIGSKENPIQNRYLSLWKENKQIMIAWNRNIDPVSRIFCEETLSEVLCQSEISVYSFMSDIKNLDFLPGETEIIILAVGENIYTLETERNPFKKPQILYQGQNPDFRLFKDTIYIKDGDLYGRLEF